jgi:hypothetical protein
MWLPTRHEGAHVQKLIHKEVLMPVFIHGYTHMYHTHMPYPCRYIQRKTKRVGACECMHVCVHQNLGIDTHTHTYTHAYMYTHAIRSYKYTCIQEPGNTLAFVYTGRMIHTDMYLRMVVARLTLLSSTPLDLCMHASSVMHEHACTLFCICARLLYNSLS